MKTYAIALWMALASMVTGAQVAAPSPPRTQPMSMGTLPADTGLNPLLAQVEQTSQAMNMDISHLRIEKWKADGAVKRQSQENADSIARNLTTALPAIIDQVRANPQSMAAGFKLYRNLDALFDVFSALTESAGAFGPKADYQALAASNANLDKVRRTVGDKLESLAANTDTEVTRLRSEVAQAQAAPPPPPKKIIVDDQEKPKKSTRKPVKKPAQAPSSAAPSTTPSAAPDKQP